MPTLRKSDFLVKKSMSKLNKNSFHKEFNANLIEGMTALVSSAWRHMNPHCAHLGKKVLNSFLDKLCRSQEESRETKSS